MKCIKGRFIRVYGYLRHSNGGNDGEQYKTEVIATRIKYTGAQEVKALRGVGLTPPLHFLLGQTGFWDRTPGVASGAPAN